MIESTAELIYVDITEEMRQNAITTSNAYKDNLSNSIRSGEGTLAGCLGEEMFQKVFPNIERVNDYDFDFTTGYKTIDVKTKERTVPPQLHYDCSVNTMNGKQRTDYYIFAQVTSDYERGWLLGKIKSSAFFEKAILHPKGSVDPNNNFTFHCDTYNIPISALRPIKLLAS